MRIAVLILAALPLFAAHVQTVKATFTSPTTTPSVSITPTAGNLLVATCIAAPETGSSTTFTVSSGTAWTQAAQGEAAFSAAWPYNVNIEVWYLPNVTGGAKTVQCGLSVASYVTLFVSEYSEAPTSNPLDGTARAGGTGTAAASAAITTANAADIIYGALVKVGSDTITAGASFTIRAEEEPDSAVSGAVEDRTVSATGSYASAFTLGASVQWYSLAVAIKQSGGGPPPATRRRIMVTQ